MSGITDPEAETRIIRMVEETRKFIVEQHKLQEEATKFNAETAKFNSEAAKLAAEAAKLNRDRLFAPVLAAAAIGGAIAAMIATLVRFL